MVRLACITLLAGLAVSAATPGATSAADRTRTLTIGMDGADVRDLQKRLARRKFLPRAAASGAFDQRTWHAVVAFQGWRRIARDGIVGPATRRELRLAGRPRPWSRRRGIEIHLAKQVLLLVDRGRTVRALHVSTGAGGTTPAGRYRIQRRERMSWSRKFKVWMPFAQYFVGGYALHEYPTVPAYPASHGCVRLPAPEAQVAWRFGRVGMRIWTSR